MKLLEERILKDGKIGEGNVLKVDSFLNHQIDVPFLTLLGKEFHRLYRDGGVNKILTIEASGIGVACLTAAEFGVPVVFAKKTLTNNIYADVYTSSVFSYTHQKNYEIVVSKQFLSKGDRVLIIDDFLAKGSALLALPLFPVHPPSCSFFASPRSLAPRKSLERNSFPFAAECRIAKAAIGHATSRIAITVLICALP